MSTAAVRSAVYNYINAPPIPGVDYVFPGIPFDQAGVAWDEILLPGQTHRCFVVVVVGDANDFGDRIFIFDGAGGRRVVPYRVNLEIYFEDIGGDPLAALNNQDAVLDAIHARMQADPSIGTSASSGLLVAATPDLRLNRGELERQGEGDTFAAWSLIEFSVSMYEFQT